MIRSVTVSVSAGSVYCQTRIYKRRCECDEPGSGVGVVLLDLPWLPRPTAGLSSQELCPEYCIVSGEK